MNTTPAIRRSQMGGTTLVTASPASTAIAEVAHRASAEPANTDHLAWVPAESERVASCVLSPSSATNTAPNVENRIFQSIAELLAGRAISPLVPLYGLP